MHSQLPPPAIGALRRRITVEALSGTPDGAGGIVSAWTTFATLWAAIVPRRGSEAFDGGRVEGRVTHDVWIRPRTDIIPGHRIRLGTRFFNIRAVLVPDQIVNRMRLVCEEHDL